MSIQLISVSYQYAPLSIREKFSLSANRGEKGVPYYVLRSVFDKNKVSYIPVDNHQVKLRELFTLEEAQELLGTEGLSKNEKLKEAVNYVLHGKEEEDGAATGRIQGRTGQENREGQPRTG